MLDACLIAIFQPLLINADSEVGGVIAGSDMRQGVVL